MNRVHTLLPVDKCQSVWYNGTMPIINIQEFNKYPKVKGIFVGGCVTRGEGSSFRAQAHSHTRTTDIWGGWICVRSIKRVFMADGIRPSNLILHELAHHLAGDSHWHDDTWMMIIHELGGQIDKQYKNTKNYKKYLKRLKGGV